MGHVTGHITRRVIRRVTWNVDWHITGCTIRHVARSIAGHITRRAGDLKKENVLLFRVPTKEAVLSHKYHVRDDFCSYFFFDIELALFPTFQLATGPY